MKRVLLSLIILKVGLACCSLAPADFHGTRGLAAEVKVHGKLVHLLGYQNTAQNKAAGGNAMFLPIPAKKGSMGPSNMLDVSACPHAMEDIQEAAARSIVTRGGLNLRDSNQVQVFDHGLYTVVLAQDANDIPQALSRVKAERRPQMAPEIFKAYATWYPGWTFALCCFNSRESAQGDPMFWWYEPLNPQQLFFPALDAHTGAPPDLESEVAVDHALAVSAISMKTSAEVHYRDKLTPQLAAYLPRRVLGHRVFGHEPNGDFVFRLSDVRAGNFRPERARPPGANSP
ncbi:MAG: hypothetical protein U0931_17950 [Vulcanimicrobiota bacterium]